MSIRSMSNVTLCILVPLFLISAQKFSFAEYSAIKNSAKLFFLESITLGKLKINDKFKNHPRAFECFESPLGRLIYRFPDKKGH